MAVELVFHQSRDGVFARLGATRLDHRFEVLVDLLRGAGADLGRLTVRHPRRAVRVWGTVSIVAIHSEPTPVNLYPMFAREVTMHGSRLYNREDWEEAIRLAASGAVTLAPLVSRKIPLEGLQEGMEEALRGGPVMKVLVDLTA